jgi:oligoendopeptidase F
VDALVQAVTGHYQWAQRYYTLKSKLLGIDDFKDYDRYAPLKKTKTTVSWKQARSMVLDAYGEFSPMMSDIALRFFDEKWIDAAIKQGKRGGAYSAGTVPSVHPYVFMNYDGRLRDVQTLAHELGHGVHQYLSRKQGALQASTPLTTAETASVFGEMLVFQRLLKQLDDPMEELALLMGKIDDTIATVFRQISMNRFEEAMHTARREEGELTTERFSELWNIEQEKLYGTSVELTPEYRHWWCYIPHFLHTPGYVYAYAFGELLVLALYEEYQRKPEGFADRYLSLLEAGGSEWPHELIARMGLDIQDPQFWQKGLASFERMILRAEELYAQVQNQ